MESYIAILRGINVAGKNKIQMADLKEKLAALHYTNLRTYIQSGNILFSYQETAQEDLRKQIEAEIFKHYQIQVPVIVLKVQELTEAVSNNPFLNQRKEDESKLHITFLSEKPKEENVEKLLAISNLPDELIVRDKLIYLFCPDGYGRTKFTNTFLEQKLKVTATTRNWKTSNKLIEITNTPS